jgi:Uma2 family endonuclease
MGGPAVKLAPTSAEEFLHWESLQSTRNEFVGGRIYAMVGASKRHFRVVRALAARLEAHLAGSPCQVYDESVKLRVGEDVFYPDILVSCDASDLEDEYLVQHPVPIAQILSPSTSQYDATAKAEIYRGIPSLKEIVLVNIARQSLTLVQRSESGWVLRDFAGDEMVTLESVQLTFRAGELFS